ncbi:MAG: hypothetical protein LH473_10225, partial [Chitinophagales bacterium]|nr:hypothetical protein [Chitinophagales bacterium]
MKKQMLLFTLIVAILFSSCKKKQVDVDYSVFLNNYIDTTAKPGDDFFKYAVGYWLKNNPIPSSEKSWGVWSKVDEETFNRVLKLNEEAALDSTAEKGGNKQKIGDFW